jgi:hypothetical protein
MFLTLFKSDKSLFISSFVLGQKNQKPKANPNGSARFATYRTTISRNKCQHCLNYNYFPTHKANFPESLHIFRNIFRAGRGQNCSLKLSSCLFINSSRNFPNLPLAARQEQQ